MEKTDRKLCVMIACHKPYRLPQDECYQPVEVGAALREEHVPGCIPDDSGDNISAKNQHYCELTALYWAWKNLSAEHIGLVQYRRYFAAGIRPHIARTEDFLKALSKAPVILPKKRHYYIETNYSHYIHAHHQQDLTVTQAVLSERFPEYLPAYESEMRKRSGHRFNMMVMRKDLFDDYCEWIFSILFEVEKRLDITDYDAYNTRVFGFISERLLDVWLVTNHIPYTEMPVICTENQHWLKKGMHFIKRKLTYKSS